MKEIRISGVIGDVFNNAADIELEIESLGLSDGDDLKVVISSEGGSVFDGYEIYNLLQRLPYNVYTEGYGLVGSIATLILLAAPKERTNISKVSMFMIHRAISPMGGNQEELEKQKRILSEIDKVLIQVYTDRTGIDAERIEQMMSEETWMAGEEAVELGFVGSLSETKSAELVASSLYSLNREKMLKSLFKNLVGEEEEKEVTNEIIEEEKKVENVVEEEEVIIKNEEDEEEEVENNASLEAKISELENKVNELAQAAAQIAEATDTLINKSLTAETVNEVVDARFENRVAGLKSTNNQPKVGNKVDGKGYIDPMAQHRAAMKEIEKKTRKF